MDVARGGTADLVERRAQRCSNLPMLRFANDLVLSPAPWVISHHLLVAGPDYPIRCEVDVVKPANHRRMYPDWVSVVAPLFLKLHTQTRSDPLLSPNSLATRLIALPAVLGSACGWINRSAARVLSSSVFDWQE